MDKEFIPHQPSLDMKELGFNEPCFKVYDKMGYLQDQQVMLDLGLDWCSAPIYSQAFRFFREEHKLFCDISVDVTDSKISFYYTITRLIEFKNKLGAGVIVEEFNVPSYKEAELACLIKLIEIAKSAK